MGLFIHNRTGAWVKSISLDDSVFISEVVSPSLMTILSCFGSFILAVRVLVLLERTMPRSGNAPSLASGGKRGVELFRQFELCAFTAFISSQSLAIRAS